MRKITYPTLRYGSEGDLVVQLQQLLSRWGSKVKTDGKYTIGTLSAVKNYQKKNGLEVTGVCDEKTWQALMKVAKVKTITAKPKLAEKEKAMSIKEKVDILWEAYQNGRKN